jgi:myo-inositol-1(or 4)-monophosphatase
MGSAAVDLAYVANGRFEAFFEYNLKAWDCAGGILLVQEAGGTLTDFKGGTNYLFGGEIIASGAIHPELLDLLKGHWYPA